MLPEGGQGSGVDVSLPCWQQHSHLDVLQEPCSHSWDRGGRAGEPPKHWCRVLLNQLLINGGALVLFAVVACVSPRWQDPALPLRVLAAFGPIFGGLEGAVWEQLSMHEVAAAL